MPFVDPKPQSRSTSDDRSEAYLEQLKDMAADRGLLDRAGNVAKTVGSSVWDTLVGLAWREESVMVGLHESFQGKEDRPGARLMREAIGGTKLGNFLGVEQPTRKTWSDLMRDPNFMSAIPDVKFSEMFGKNMLTRFLDPSARQAAALGLSIFASPSTYLWMGANGAVKFAGKAGTIIASPKAQKLADTLYKRSLKSLGANHGLKAPLTEAGEAWARFEDTVLTLERNSQKLAGMMEAGYTDVALRLQQNAQRRVADYALRGGKQAAKDAGLDLGRSIRWGDTTFIPFVPNVKGIRLVDLDKMGAHGQLLLDAFKNGRATRDLAKGIGKVVDTFDKTFKRVPRQIRSSGLFKAIEERRHSFMSGATAIVGRHMKEIRGNIPRKVWNNTEFQDLYKLAADNPNKYMRDFLDLAERMIGKGGREMAETSMRQWRAVASNMGASSVKVGMLSPQQVAKYENGYFPHDLDLKSVDLDELYKRIRGPGEFTGGNINPHEMDRVFDTLDELKDALLRDGYSPDEINKLLSKSLDESMQAYMHKTIRGVAGINFANDIMAEIVPTFGDVFQKLDSEIPDLVKRAMKDFRAGNVWSHDKMVVAKEALWQLERLVQGRRTAAEHRALGTLQGTAADIAEATAGLAKAEREELADALAALRKLGDTERAAIVYEAAWKSRNLADVGVLIEAAGGVIRDPTARKAVADAAKAAGKKPVYPLLQHTSLRALNSLRQNTMHSLRLFRDGDVTVHRFKTGKLDGVEVLVPKAVKAFFETNETQIAHGLTKESRGILKAYDVITNSFKSSHTIFFPAFHARNAISNVAAMGATMGIDAFLNPARMKRTLDIINGTGDWTIKAGGRSYTRQQLTKFFYGMDITPQRALQQELQGGVGTLADVIPGVVGRGAKKLEAGAGRIGAGVENGARGMYTLALIESGMDMATAARKMKQVLFDYNDLSKIEQDWFKRIFPFYTWTRKNLELQIQNLATRPGGTVNQIRLLNNGERGPESDLMPEFMRGEMKVGLDGEPGKARFLTNIDLPVTNIDVLWAGGVRETMQEHWSMISPVLKNPMEYLLNLDTFTGKKISDRKWINAMGPVLDERITNQSIKDWLQLKQVNFKDGSVGWTINGTKYWMMSKSVLTGRLLNEVIKGERARSAFYEELGKGDKTMGMVRILEFFSGMRMTEIDIEKGEKQALAREIKRIEGILLQTGDVAQFKRVYIP